MSPIRAAHLETRKSRAHQQERPRELEATVTDTLISPERSFSLQSTSASKLSTPALDGADILSDYIPQSNEISRVPSTAGGPDEDAERRDQVARNDEQDDQDEEDEDDAEYDSEGNVVMKTGAANGKGKSKTAVKKEAKRKFDEKVSAGPRRPFPDLSLAGAFRYQDLHSGRRLVCLRLPALARSLPHAGRPKPRSNLPIRSSGSPTSSARPTCSSTFVTSRCVPLPTLRALQVLI